MTEIEKVAQECINEHLNLSSNNVFPPTSAFYTMGFDSLEMMEIIMSMENRLLITISNDDAARIRTFKDLCETFERYV